MYPPLNNATRPPTPQFLMPLLPSLISTRPNFSVDLVTRYRDGSAYGHAYRLLGHLLSGSLFVEPYIVTLGERAQPCSIFQNTGLEFIHVLEGEMLYRYGSKVYPLKPGDTLLFDAHGHNEPEEIQKAPANYLAVVFNIRDMNYRLPVT